MAERSEPKSRLRGVLASIAYFTAVGAVVVGIYLLSPALSGDDASSTPSLGDPEVTSSDRGALSGEEPVADAAEVILPSVVHIQTENGLGSGIIYSAEGLIVTAAHIVQDHDTVRVRFYNGDQVDGTVLGTSPDVDIAVIRVEASGIQPAVFSLDKPRVGQMAIAVGSPFTLESTVTAGIISAVDRSFCDDGMCSSMIQTDAAINPGNSGGALVNRHGEVVGLNVSIFSQSGANDGVGFAVPSETVIAYADGIVSGTPLQAAFLGVRGHYATGDRAGALIMEVFDGTAAADAGVMVDDVVISVNGVGVQGIDDLAAQVRAYQPGDTVLMVLIRDGEEMTLEITLGSRDDAN